VYSGVHRTGLEAPVPLPGVPRKPLLQI
jgi:hypothetical protein